MLRATLRLPVAALAALALAASASTAGHGCGGVVFLEPAPGVYYVHDHGWLCAAPMCNPLAGWVYVETNGESGLQRGGGALFDLYQDECQESPNPDLLVY